VTHTPEVHVKIEKLLKELREEMAVQVAIEAMFLAVSNNFLEEIGLDLDVVLNAGNAGYDRAVGFADPATGAQVLIPRQNSRLGFVPTTPAGGTAMSQQTPAQPWLSAGLVPQTGTVGPHSSQWTPIGIRQDHLSMTAPQQTGVPGSLGGGAIGQAISLAGSFLDNLQVDFLIRATQADRRSSRVEAPRVVVPNGGSGYIRVGETVNYVASLDAVAGTSTLGTVAVPAYIPQVDTLDLGRMLWVQASVSPDRRYVTMTLSPYTTELVAIETFAVQQGGVNPGVSGVGNIQQPRTRDTEIMTTASVPDGGTLLIGGLKLGGEVEIEAGVPVLNKIPVLKRAFSNRSLVKDEQTLLILVKPKIIIRKEAEDDAFPGFETAATE